MSITDLLNIKTPSPLNECDFFAGSDHCAPQFMIKRDDLIHPIISGNKWRKLQALFTCEDLFKYEAIVSFGGGFSNHLHAIGFCCQQLNIPFHAMIRGNYEEQLSPMLNDLKTWSAQLHWLTKIEYKNRAQVEFLDKLKDKFPNALFIAEGGSHQHALIGMQALIDELPEEIDAILCPVASAGTMAGLIAAATLTKRHIEIIGIAMLKGEGYLEDLVTELLHKMLPEHCQRQQLIKWEIRHDFHCGGYAKTTDALLQFCKIFSHDTQVPVEPVYSGKLMYAATQLQQQGQLRDFNKIVLLHTGGLQGAR